MSVTDSRQGDWVSLPGATGKALICEPQKVTESLLKAGAVPPAGLGNPGKPGHSLVPLPAQDGNVPLSLATALPPDLESLTSDLSQ